MVDERIYEQFRAIGRDLYVANMISSHGGNISVRLGDRVVIKRRGAMLGQLQPHDANEIRDGVGQFGIGPDRGIADAHACARRAGI